MEYTYTWLYVRSVMSICLLQLESCHEALEWSVFPRTWLLRVYLLIFEFVLMHVILLIWELCYSMLRTNALGQGNNKTEHCLIYIKYLVSNYVVECSCCLCYGMSKNYSMPWANIITRPGSTITSSVMWTLSQLSTSTACLPAMTKPLISQGMCFSMEFWTQHSPGMRRQM